MGDNTDPSKTGDYSHEQNQERVNSASETVSDSNETVKEHEVGIDPDKRIVPPESDLGYQFPQSSASKETGPVVSGNTEGSNENPSDIHIEVNGAEEDNEELARADTSSDMPVTSGLGSFATPSKQLPPLNEIEPISTPKVFAVAKDPDSSPVKNNIFKSFLNLNKYYDDQLLSEALQRKYVEFEDLKSELSLLKLNQEGSIQITQKKLTTLQTKLNETVMIRSSLEESNDSLQTENSSQKQSLEDLQRENSSLKFKADQLENKEREFEQFIANLRGDKDLEILRLNESVNRLTSSNIEQSQKINDLTKEVNDLRNERFSLKLDVTKSSNRLAYLSDQKNWYESELGSVQTKFTELIKKHDSEYLVSMNKIASLTSQNESFELKLKNQTDLITDLKKNLEDEISKSSSLESKLEIDRMRLLKELQGKDELLELIKAQSDQRIERINQLEAYADDLKANLGDSIEKLENEVSRKTDSELKLKEKLKRAEDALDTELHKETDLPKLSATSELIASEGISLSSVYSEFNHLKKQLALERSQKEKLASQLESFVNELESKKPALASYRDQIQFYERSLKEMIGKVEAVRLEKADAERYSKNLKLRIGDLENELVSIKKISKDLGTQLCYYLIHSKIRDDGDDPLTISERKAIESILNKTGNNENIEDSDTDRLISERLVTFNSIIELQHRNQELLTAIRQLGRKLESKEDDESKIESAVIEEAKDAILTLQSELESVQLKLSTAEKEKDLLKSISGGSNVSAGASVPQLKFLEEHNENLKKRLSEAEKILSDNQSQSSASVRELNNKLRESTMEKNDLALKLSTMKHTVDLSETRYSNAQKSLDSTKSDVEQLKKDIDFWKEQASKQENMLISRTNEMRDLESKVTSMQINVKNLEIEVELRNSSSKSLKEDISHLKSDKANLNDFVVNLQSLLKERDNANKELSDRLNKSIDNYQSLQERLSDKEERILILTSQSDMALKAQNTKLEQVNEISKNLLDARNKLIEKESDIAQLKRNIKELKESTHRSSINSLVEAHTGSDDKTIHIELQLTKEDLRIAEGQVHEFSKLAQAAEDALYSATKSFDEYKSQSDAKYNSLLKQKYEADSDTTKLRSSLDIVNKELESARKQHSLELDQIYARLDQFSLKAASYDELQRDYESKMELFKTDVNNQTQIASDNQEKYLAESKKNEELSKHVAFLKEESSSLADSLNTFKIKVEDLNTKLSSREAIANDERQELKDNLEASNIKISELQEQNSIILNQLELSNAPAMNVADESSSSDLKEVVSYLRRGKEGAEAKVNVLTEESQRLQLRLNQALAELEVTKSGLLKASATHVNVEETTNEHKKILEQLEQLNILRESNTTLRSEGSLRAKRIEELEVKINSLNAQIEPLQTEVSHLTTEFELREQRVRLLEEENGKLKNKASTPVDGNLEKEYDSLKQKYNSIREKANARIQAQNDKIKELQANLSSLKEKADDSQKQADTEKSNIKNEELASANSKLEKLTTDSQRIINELTERRSQLEAEVKSLKEQLASLSAPSTEKVTGETAEKFKSDLEKKFREEFDQKLALELQNAKTSDVDADKLRQEIEKEFKAKLEEVQQSIEKEKQKLETQYHVKFSQELKAKVEEEVAKSGTNYSGDVERLREEITQEHQQKLKQMEDEFASKLKKEKEETEKQIVKKYELKMKLLNKKLDKLDSKNTQSVKNTENVDTSGSTPQQGEQGGNAAVQSAFQGATSQFSGLITDPSSSGIQKRAEQTSNLSDNSFPPEGARDSSVTDESPLVESEESQKNKLGHQFTESTLTVRRPTVDRAQSNERKRQHPGNQNNQQKKKSKE